MAGAGPRCSRSSSSGSQPQGAAPPALAGGGGSQQSWGQGRDLEKRLVTPVTAHRRVSTSVVLGRGAGSWGAEPRYPHTRAWHQEGPTPPPRARAASQARAHSAASMSSTRRMGRAWRLGPATRAPRFQGCKGGGRRGRETPPEGRAVQAVPDARLRLRTRRPCAGKEVRGCPPSRAAPRQLAWGRCSATSLPVCCRGTSRVASRPSGVGAFCAQGALGRGAQGGRRGRGCRQG